ncbi:hypothetical protein M413DRAFT_450006 [Hebeloma cylindrosporum]|uniref:Uncharacterized protein n=1 Tax=Hebeloma cylindrosporum TaxID=76867 RepID=A0A0C3BDM7_HEBCY|nr:hypothetical protein M413DRAFT_450006 [Hebeloma cylindrosporum h7]
MGLLLVLEIQIYRLWVHIGWYFLHLVSRKFVISAHKHRTNPIFSNLNNHNNRGYRNILNLFFSLFSEIPVRSADY